VAAIARCVGNLAESVSIISSNNPPGLRASPFIGTDIGTQSATVKHDVARRRVMASDWGLLAEMAWCLVARRWVELERVV
jgi:hypothetical protein